MKRKVTITCEVEVDCCKRDTSLEKYLKEFVLPAAWGREDGWQDTRFSKVRYKISKISKIK